MESSEQALWKQRWIAALSLVCWGRGTASLLVSLDVSESELTYLPSRIPPQVPKCFAIEESTKQFNIFIDIKAKDALHTQIIFYP